MIDWSHALLDDDERRLFHRLAFFTDGFDLEAATSVAADGDAALASDAIGRLADKSLLVHRHDETGSRWRMLETVHAYAREQLEASGEVPTMPIGTWSGPRRGRRAGSRPRRLRGVAARRRRRGRRPPGGSSGRRRSDAPATAPTSPWPSPWVI